MEQHIVSFFNPKDVHSARARTRSMVTAASYLLMLIGFGWALYFLIIGNWLTAGLELLIAAAGLYIRHLQRQGRTRPASALLFTLAFLAIATFSLVLDVPTIAVPRSSHLYFLTVGLCAYYVLHEEQPWLRYGVPSLFFAAFYFFACTHFSFDTPYAMPDSVRLGGTWVNAAGAMFVLLITLFLMNTDPAMRGGLHSAMRDGLAARHFSLHYQPQVDADGKVVGAEALLRWKNPERGSISPAEFIPLAEQTGFILTLGAWALNEACTRLAQWQHDEQLRPLMLSVNVSAYQIQQPDFVDVVRTILARTGAPAHKLKLELTESMLVNDIEDLICKMQALAQLGVGFSLDDFGTGYSSLAYLKRLPLHQLKIDKSFVRDVPTDRNAAAIAKTLIALGQSLNLKVVAEGIETQQQQTFLLDLGCRVFQGYLLSRPLEAEAFEAFTSRLNKDHAAAQASAEASGA